MSTVIALRTTDKYHLAIDSAWGYYGRSVITKREKPHFMEYDRPKFSIAVSGYCEFLPLLRESIDMASGYSDVGMNYFEKVAEYYGDLCQDKFGYFKKRDRNMKALAISPFGMYLIDEFQAFELQGPVEGIGSGHKYAMGALHQQMQSGAELDLLSAMLIAVQIDRATDQPIRIRSYEIQKKKPD